MHQYFVCYKLVTRFTWYICVYISTAAILCVWLRTCEEGKVRDTGALFTDTNFSRVENIRIWHDAKPVTRFAGYFFFLCLWFYSYYVSVWTCTGEEAIVWGTGALFTETHFSRVECNRILHDANPVTGSTRYNYVYICIATTSWVWVYTGLVWKQQCETLAFCMQRLMSCL
jgi:hypothetical protein